MKLTKTYLRTLFNHDGECFTWNISPDGVQEPGKQVNTSPMVGTGNDKKVMLVQCTILTQWMIATSSYKVMPIIFGLISDMGECRQRKEVSICKPVESVQLVSTIAKSQVYYQKVFIEGCCEGDALTLYLDRLADMQSHQIYKAQHPNNEYLIYRRELGGAPTT